MEYNKPYKSEENSVSEALQHDSGGSTPKPTKKIKVLVLCDSPTCATGFATVSKNILKVLADTGKYDIDIVGINFDGSFYDREKYPYRIYPAMNALIPHPAYSRDLFGKQLLLDKLGSRKYDLLWILQDTFIVESLGQKIIETNEALPPDKRFKWIYYFPIDATPKKSWVDNSVLLADYPVAYTKYGYDECLKIYKTNKGSKLEKEQIEENAQALALLEAKLNVIYHGANLKQFYPIKDRTQQELKKKFFRGKADKFIFMNMNRNQPRKDLFRSMEACKMLLDRRREKGKDDVYFYFHCQYADMSGLDLIQMSKQLRFVQGNEWGFPDPKNFNQSQGFPIKIINEIYNAVDCIISSALGEGFGLSNVEGMATKTPIIMPDNTPLPEIVGTGGERGLLAGRGESIVLANDNDRVRPRTDLKDLADKMEWVLENPDKVKSMVERAYKWVTGLDWGGDLIGGKWRMLFEKAYEQLVNERKVAMVESQVDFSKLGRNRKCPICGIKFKRCPHYEKKRGLFGKFLGKKK